MVDALLDTNILVDFLRSHSQAIAWKNSLGNAILGIPSIVYLEIVQGALNKADLNQALKFLRQFQVIYLTNDDQTWAIAQLAQYKLSNNVDLTDALIAAPAHRLNLPLYTRNIKHFRPMIPALIKQPY